MKKIFAVILSLLLLMACADSSRVAETLAVAERDMDARPDSVLELLRSLPADSIGDDRDRALYALMLSRALDKNYIDLTDDSIIAVAVDYFSEADEPRYEMLSQFYLGRVRFNARDYSGSLVAMFKALELARQIDDPFWIAMAAREIGRTYKTAFNGIEAAYYYKIALENFVRSGNLQFIESSIANYVRSYNNSKQHDSCILIAEKFLDLEGEGFMGLYSNDEKWRHVVMYSIGTSQISLNRYIDAVKTFEKMCESPYALTYDSAWYALAKVRAGEHEDVSSFIRNRCDNDSDILYCELKYRYYEAVDSPKQALEYLKLVYKFTNDELKNRIFQDLTGPVVQLLESQKETKQSLIEHNRTVHFSVIVFLSVIMVLMSLYIRNRIRRQRELISNNVEIVEDLQRSLSLKESEIAMAQNSIKQLLGERYCYFDELCSVYYSNSDKDTAKKISDELVKFAHEMSTKSKIADLEVMVNSHFDNIFVMFRQDLPNLAENDYRLFLFTILGFSSNAIALFLNNDKITAVYDRRRKIKQKIKMLGEPKTSLYLSFFR